MKIDRRLNLVQSFDTSAGKVYIHSTPISHDVWRNYFLILGKTYAQIMAQGLNVVAGPAMAVLMLERLARLDGTWDGPDGVSNGLMAEIRRLTNVAVPSSTGWNTIPYDQALSQGIFDPEDIEDMEGAIVFFICASAALRGQNAQERLTIIFGMMESQWRTQNTSLGSMAFAASLPTSTPGETIGEKPPDSSVPR